MEMAPTLCYDLFLPVMENIPLAVLVIDHNFSYVYCNSLFKSFSGLDSVQIEGMRWSQFLPPHRQQLLFGELSAMRHHLAKSQERNYTFANGHGYNTNWTIAMGNDEKLGEFYVLTFKEQPHTPSFLLSSTRHACSLKGDEKREINLTKNRREEHVLKTSTLEKLNGELNASNKLKDKVLSVIAHDVRAPIASLKGLTSTFLDTDLSSEEKILLREDLLKQLGAVADLTENILLWATNSFTKTKSETIEKIEVLEIVENNRAVIDHLALAKNVSVRYDIPAGLTIRVNKDQFSTVIRNLATNAIKYTPASGHITIAATLEDFYIQIKVSDTGIGIDEDHQKTLFTFSQSSTYGTNGEKGIGLGLLLCKEYVEANAGKISVSSKPNIGTTVITQFPAAF
jgi:PAS domain S-box-containing protein